MTYISKRCPHCNEAYAFWKPKNEYEYGSPVRACSHCGKIFIDRRYREIAITGVDNIDKRRFSLEMLISAVLGAIFAYSGFLHSNIYAIAGGLVATVVFTGMVAYDASTFQSRQTYIQQQTTESFKRMSDPNYLETLDFYGFNVSKFKDN